MACQCGVVNLDVNLEVLVKSVCAEESDNGLGVNIVLVLCRLHRLGLDEECALESLCTCIVAGHLEHCCHMLFLTLHIGVQEAHVTLAATPEYVALATQLDCCIDSVLDLNHSAGCNVKVRVGGSAVHITLVSKYVGCSPKELDAGLCLFLLEVCDNLLEVLLVLLDCVSLCYEVNIVEAVIADSEFLHELEACVNFVLSCLYRIRISVPREALCAGTELVAALCAQCVPPSHSELEPVLHLLSTYFLLRIIVMEGHRVL